MSVRSIQDVNDTLLLNGHLRVVKTAEARQLPPAPASPQAVPTETARAQANSSVFMLQMMQPSFDSIYKVGATAVKTSGGIKSISSTHNWGF